jgi:FEZ-like protein
MRGQQGCESGFAQLGILSNFNNLYLSVTDFLYFALLQRSSISSDVLDLPDDEELQQSMDLHSLITSCDHEEEPLANVDQVISEIEEMMEVNI